MKNEKPLAVNKGSFGGRCGANEERLPEGLPVVNDCFDTPVVGHSTPLHEVVGDPPQGGDAAPAALRPGCGSPSLSKIRDNCTGNQLRVREFKLSSSENKTALVLRENVGKMVELCGLERVGFLTLTTPDNCSYWTREGWDEGQRRFHSFMSHSYPDIFGQSSKRVIVLEPQDRGAIHWHMLIECPCDIRTGVNFAEFNEKPRGNYRSAPAGLKELWKLLRESCKIYGLVRHELLPICSTKKAVSEYVGKYIGKTIEMEARVGLGGVRRPFKVRRVRYFQGTWRSANTRFAWVGAGRTWRAAVALTAAQLGIKDMAGFSMRFGSKWAHQLGGAIMENYER